MVFFFWESLPKIRYLSSRAPDLSGPQRTVIFHTISWASLKILPIWLNILAVIFRLKERAKNHLFFYECLSHSLIPGYLILCLDKAFPELGPSYHLSIERAAHLLQRRSLMMSLLFGIACFHQTFRNNLPLRSSFFWLGSHPICQVLELLWVWEGADIHPPFLHPSILNS